MIMSWGFFFFGGSLFLFLFNTIIIMIELIDNE